MVPSTIETKHPRCNPIDTATDPANADTIRNDQQEISCFCNKLDFPLTGNRDVPMTNPTTSSFPIFLFQGLRRLVRHHAVPQTPRLPKPMTAAAPFSTTARQLQRQMPSRPKPPPEDEIEEAFLKGSGPGGQKIVCQARDAHPASTNPSSFSTATQHCYLTRHHPNRSNPEQNQLGCPAQAYSHRYRDQMPGHPFTRAESENCPGAPRR